MLTHVPDTLRPNFCRMHMDGTVPQPALFHAVHPSGDGLFCFGVYTTWLRVSVYLTSASLDQNPPRRLCFRFEKYVLNPYGPNQILPICPGVLIPLGCESDVAHLHQELTARCPKARIALS
jgi:hypothetical protein